MCDALCLYVSFKYYGLECGFVWAPGNGTFGEIYVHVCPFYKPLEFLYLGLYVVNVVHEKG